MFSTGMYSFLNTANVAEIAARSVGGRRSCMSSFVNIANVAEIAARSVGAACRSVKVAEIAGL